MYIKDCAGKTQPDSDRYIRIASRTEAENCKLVKALANIIDLKKTEIS
jgi:histidinol-phosphate/aromatic aminotransferase/cobyric acid decarboxylase-like protein